MSERVLICGGRDYDDRGAMAEVICSLSGLDIVITGGARGADSLAVELAHERGLHTAVVTALWPLYGKSAGYRRNAAMLELRPDRVVAFPGGNGTRMMMNLAQDAGISVTNIQL